jgi:integral membrane protein
VKQLFWAYRVLATVVGLSIITLVVIGVPLKYLHDLFPDFWPGFLQVGEPGQQLGVDINLYLGTAHGFIYMLFVLVALMLALKTRWPMGFTLITLVSGTIPVVSFWAEARAIRRVKAQHPELSGAPAPSLAGSR